MAYSTVPRWYIVGEKEDKIHVMSHSLTWTTDAKSAATYQHPGQASMVLEGLKRMEFGGRSEVKNVKCLRVNDLDALLMQQMLTQISDGDY